MSPRAALATLLLLAGAAAAEPRLTLAPERVEFGRVRADRVLQRTLSVANVGSSPLELRAVRSECGCVAAPEWREPRTLEPGQRAALQLTFSTGPTPGHVVRKVWLESNDPRRPELELRLEATVVAAPRGR